MINEERIRLMTRLAIYESGEGKDDIPVGRYFRTDYIWLQMLVSFAFGTIAFLIICGGVICFFMDDLLERIYEEGFTRLLAGVGILYLVFMIVYLLASYLWASRRYSKARKSLKNYHTDLKKLQKQYNEKTP
jgi:predicted PurR-regulated permease PerM